MGLEKAIEHGKEHRKPYTDWRNWSSAARNHGKDPWYRGNRMYGTKKRKEALKAREDEMTL